MKQTIKYILMLAALLVWAGGAALAANLPAAADIKEEAKEGLSAGAQIVFNVGPLAITNSMVVTIIVTIGIVVFAQLISRNVKPIPSGFQNFGEWMVEALYSFLEGILGPELVKKTFWFFGSLFLFILITNWIGLVPGVGTLGWGHYDASGHFHMGRALLRGGNADLNMTTAMSLLFCVLWLIWGLQANGVVGFFKHIFAPKGKTTGFMAIVMVLVFFFVGILEVISIAFRPVSLSFRLFGNVFAGENMLESMMNLVPWLGWIIPLPFYFLELLVGFVQALVFTLLTAVFTVLICQHDDHGDHAEEHAEQKH